MILKDLLIQTTFDEIVQTVESDYVSFGIEVTDDRKRQWKQMFNSLCEMEPSQDVDRILMGISDNLYELYKELNPEGTTDYSEHDYSLIAIPWCDWLGSEVDETIFNDKTVEEILGHSFFLMNWRGRGGKTVLNAAEKEEKERLEMRFLKKYLPYVLPEVIETYPFYEFEDTTKYALYDEKGVFCTDIDFKTLGLSLTSDSQKHARVSLIENNPLRVLGVYSNSTLREMVQNKVQLQTFARVGQEVRFPLWLNGLSLMSPLPNITEDLIEQSQAQLSLQGDRDRFALFWFEKDNEHAQVDHEAFALLNHDRMEDACQLWRQRKDSAAHKNLLLLSVIRKDWKDISVYAAKYYVGNVPGFRLFMKELVKESYMANNPDSHCLLDYFAQEPWNFEMRRILVDNHKHQLDESIYRLKRVETTDVQLLRKTIDKGLEDLGHVEALKNLKGSNFDDYLYYANEMAKVLLKVIFQYLRMNYPHDLIWSAKIVNELWKFLGKNEPERDELLQGSYALICILLAFHSIGFLS